MINLNKMWINLRTNKKYTRDVKEVNYDNINISDYLIIDVRSRREFNENHLNGAINIPLLEIKRNIEKQVKNKDKKILVCCEYGIRSKQATAIIENLGYTQVYNLKGGLENI